MTKKTIRLDAIRKIIDSDAGSTHEEIKAFLEEQGIKASQSTLSRDLREIGAVKVPTKNGGSVYRIRGSEMTGYGITGLEQAIIEFGITCEDIGNFLVIKTRPGNARDFCLVLDRQEWSEIIGTIAGDDTILVISRTSSDIKRIIERLK